MANIILPGEDRELNRRSFLKVAGFGAAAIATMTVVGWYDGNDGAGIIGAIIGALLILGIYRMVAQRNNTPVV